MYNISKGSVISERQYGVELICEIISDVEVKGNQQEFTAVIKTVNGSSLTEGKEVEYLVGGTYGASISVVKE